MMKKYIITFMALFFVHLLNAQKVGIVLSGGGAKGLYHIGVLKALEENNIPIDYISGTSMGAIIGGFYAAGYTPWEIENIVVGPALSLWISGTIDPKYSYYYNELPLRPSMVSYDIDVDDIISKFKWQKKLKEEQIVPTYYDVDRNNALPANIISSTQLDIALMEYFSGANAFAKNDFDSLYIPFRCVSVDAVTKTQRFWGKGDLSLAIRASMAIPIVFSPVVVDSAVMFDGSVLNNFPWKESNELWKPDFIIGSRCVAGDVLDLSTPMGQGMALMFSPTDYNMPDSLGIMIGRGVNVGALDFHKAKQIIELGYNDTMAEMPEILERIPYFISSEERDYKRLLFKQKIPSLVFKSKQVDNELVYDMIISDTTKQSDRQYYRNALKIEKVKKQEQDTVGLAKKAMRNKKIIGVDEFKHKYYRRITEGAAQTDFPYAIYNDSTGVFDFKIKLYHDPILTVKAGFNVSSATINQGFLGLSYRRSKLITSFFNIDGYFGAFYNSGQFSNRFNFYRGDANIYMYNTFTYNYLNFNRANNQKYFYNGNYYGQSNMLNEYYISSLIGMPMGAKSKFELRGAIGLDNFKYSFNNNTNANEMKEYIYKSILSFATLNAAISTSTLNDPFYPTSGVSQKFSASVSFGHEVRKWKNNDNPNTTSTIANNTNYWASIKFHRIQYKYVNKYFSFGYLIEGVFANPPKFSTEIVGNMAPKFEPTQFSKTIFVPEFQNFTYASVGVMPIFTIFDKLEMRTEAYAYIGDLFMPNIKNLKYILSATLAYKLPFTTISLSYNRLDTHTVKKNYFLLNIGVMLFNNRGVIY